MKTKLLFFGMFLSINLANGQATTNQSITQVQPAITNPIAGFTGESFRFRAGIVTQLDAGNNFDLSPTSPLNSRWFSLGGINTSPPSVTPARRAYGLRFQADNKAVTFGYQNVNDVLNINPRIEWIGTGSALGNLEFRVANSFTSTVSTLVATMTKFGNTVFGDISSFGVPSAISSKVGIASNNPFSLQVLGGITAGVSIDNPTLCLKITSTDVGEDIVAKSKGLNIQVSGSSNIVGINAEVLNGINNTGMKVITKGGNLCIGIDAIATNGLSRNIGVLGTTFGTGSFEAGIYGSTPVGTSRFAGYFDGNVFTTGAYLPSDLKLKSNINKELNAIDRISLLNPVTYNYNKISEMNLPLGSQHGFISQELAEIFPELTEDISKPVFDKENKIIGNFDFKAVNYNGLISILTAGIQELNNELKSVKEELATLKNVKNSNSNLLENNTKAFMEQNIPNPFTDQTTIRYQLPENSTSAEIMVMDLNGTLIKSYAINKNQSEIIVKSSEIGKGLFIYSLVQNGHEIVTKKMIVK